MSVSHSIRVLAFALIVCTSTVVYAQSGNSRYRDRQLVILSVAVDRASQTLTIRGRNFGRSAPQVLCEWKPMKVMSAADDTVVVRLPATTHDGTYLLTVARGVSPGDRDVFYTTVQSAEVAGTPGPMGPTGLQGLTGTQGMPGPIGPTGAAGSTGPAGPVGPAGPTGPAGAVGPLGPAGATGPAGPQGDIGPKGDTGSTGATGAKGDTGATGDTGAMGATGATGAKGDTGATGATGDKGDKGDTGATGAQGVVGPAGPQGDSGPEGSQGMVGPQGPAGPEGPAGVSGFEVVYAVSPSAPMALGAFTTLSGSATCPAGKHVIAGGHESLSNAAFMNLVASYPSAAATWRVTIINALNPPQSMNNVQLRVYAVCVAN